MREHPDRSGPAHCGPLVRGTLRRRLRGIGGYLLACFLDGLVASGSAWCPGVWCGGDSRSARRRAELKIRREVHDGLCQLEDYLAATTPRDLRRADGDPGRRADRRADGSAQRERDARPDA